MKIKHRALALILSVMMVLTFMPAMAFAEGENPTGPHYWSTECEDVVLAPGESSCDLSISVELDSEAYAVDGLEDPTFSYRWTKYDEDTEEYIACGTGNILTGATVGAYMYYVTDSYGNEDYNYAYVNYPEVIGLDFTPASEATREVWSDNPFRDGDKITLHYQDFDEVMTYEYKAGKWLNNGQEVPGIVDAVYEDGTFDVGDEDNIGEQFTYVVRYDYDRDISDGPFDAKCISGVTNISYSPATFSVWGPDIQETNPYGSYYDIEYRYKWASPNGETYYRWFASGDSMTVTYLDGTSVNYKAMMCDYGDGDYWPGFDDGYSRIYPELNYDYDKGLQPGNNNATISFRGVSTPIVIFIDTPELKAQRDKEAADKAQAEQDNLEWNGTWSGAVPAAKSVKAKAAKKKVTVSWKKADKKKLKKFDKVEIQVCPDKGFARANTIRKEVKKSKKSIKINKLQSKKTYYVRVRDVKGSGTTKLVSDWSSLKRVKIK